MTYRYQNKRIVKRVGGRFARVTAADMGIGGACPKCRHLMVRHYDGDPNAQFPDPRAFRYRCFTCEPLTDEEMFAPFIERMTK